jgi:hypothetical protein
VLPLEERDQHNRGADVRDDQDQLQEHPEVDAVVGTASGDVALGVVDNGLREETAGIEVMKVMRYSAPKASEILLYGLTWTPLVARTEGVTLIART